MRPLVQEATELRLNKQRGASLLLFIVGILLALGTVYAANVLTSAKRGANQAEVSAANFQAIQTALFAYVAVNGHLPCPANPLAANDGGSDPLPPANACSTPNGVVPWATLGISPEAALDGWNRKISFRVLDGPSGLTRAGGASMVNCDTKIPYGADQFNPGDLCNALHTHLDSQFLNAKGLVVNDSGTLVSGVAFVLISHGESGYGAYLPGGGRVQMPPAGDELTNTAAASPFVKKTHSAPGIDPSVAAHFDDVVTWVSISDLARNSGRQARDWPDANPPEITVPTTTNMTSAGSGHFNATTAGGGETFAATSTTSNGQPATTLMFGGGSASYANCIWWPTSFKIYNGSDRSVLRTYLEFSTADASHGSLDDFGGFTVGFLSKSATISTGQPLTALCGDATVADDLGWGNGATGLGNLPLQRFAVEFDTYRNVGTYHDPVPNHLAIDFDDVKHDRTHAADCSMSSDSYHNNGVTNDCYTGPNNAWLRSGLASFHRMRVEVVARDPACSAGAAPRMKVWILPQSVCPDGTTDPTCVSAKNLQQAFSPTLPLPTGVVAIESCIPMPLPSTAFDELYFGFTAANRPSASSGPLLYIRNLDAASYFTP